MNYIQLYFIGFSIVLLSTISHFLIYGFQPLKGLYLSGVFIGYTIVLTTLALESNIFEKGEASE